MKIFFSYTLKSQDLSVDLLKKIKKKISKLTNIDTYIDILDNNEKEHQDYVAIRLCLYIKNFYDR